MKGHRYKPPTTPAVPQAVQAADARMAAAKRQFTAAALACLRGAVDAAEQVSLALREVDAARKAIREVGDG
jgi:hypothetical protein